MYVISLPYWTVPNPLYLDIWPTYEGSGWSLLVRKGFGCTTAWPLPKRKPIRCCWIVWPSALTTRPFLKKTRDGWR